jgi:hypothetical protein
MQQEGSIVTDRSEERHGVEIQGRYRTGSGISYDVTVHDLSLHGCRIFDKFSNLNPDKQISIRIGSIGPIFAQVRWREGQVVGIKFNDALHPSVLQHMRHTID